MADNDDDEENEEKPKPPTVDLTEENLQTKEAIDLLGTLASAGLKNYGQATFIKRPDGGVTYANPAHVFVHPDAVPDISDKPFRLVRPILGSGRPIFVVWHNNVLWEIEFTDDEPEEDPSSADN